MTLADIIRDFLGALFSFDSAHPLLFTQFYFWAFFALVFAGFSLIHPSGSRCRSWWTWASWPISSTRTSSRIS